MSRAKKRPAMSLGDMKAAKEGAATITTIARFSTETGTTTPASSTPAAAAPKPKRAGRRGQTLRLTPQAWLQLKLLALEVSQARTDGKITTAHDLLLEGVNAVFARHGKPRIA